MSDGRKMSLAEIDQALERLAEIGLRARERALKNGLTEEEFEKIVHDVLSEENDE